MKKNFFLLSLLSLLGLVVSCYDDSELRERIEKLENATAVVINQQIAALQSSIETLKSVDFDLKNQIAALEATDTSHQDEIDALKKAIEELQGIDENHQSNIDSLYYLISILEATDTSHQDEIDALKEKDEELLRNIDELQDGIDSLRTWVEDILKNYTTTEEMNEQFAAVQEQIDQLKVQVALLLAAPDILFDVDGSVAYSPGTTIEVKYTLVNTDEETEVECISDAGWKAGIIPAKDGKSGIISVTTPSEGGEGKVLVFVSTKLNTAMRVLRFEQGTLTVLTNSIAVEPQDTLLTIDARTNVDYKVVIPTEAQSWIELISVDTRATMRTDVITLSVKANTTNQNRSAIITFVDTNDKELSSFTIYQRANVQANNEIWYTSRDGNIIEPKRAFGGVNIVSNTYVKGKGIIVFDGEIKAIGSRAFSETHLQSISIPDSVTSIGYAAFYGCSSLTSVTIPNSVTNIGESAFWGCSSLTFVTIPNSVVSIPYGCFSGCCSLTSITIPSLVISIGGSAFLGCSSLTFVTIPNSVVSISNDAFQYCSSLTSVTIGNSVTSIGGGAFEGCSSLTSVTIPNSVTGIGDFAFEDCGSLTSVTIGNSVTRIGGHAFSCGTSLTLVVCLPTTPPMIFDGLQYAFPIDVVANCCTLCVPAGCVDSYAASEGWEFFKEIKEIE